MQGSNEKQVQTSGVIRRLVLGPLFVHNNHISGGFRTAKGCGVCAEGLAAAIETTEETPAGDRRDGVVASDGADQKGSATSPSGDGAGTAGDGDSLLAW